MLRRAFLFGVFIVGVFCVLGDCLGGFDVGPEEVITAGGLAIQVDNYSVPSYVDWDGDGKKDLVVGEKTASGVGRVRVYLNKGTASSPQFDSYFLAQSGSHDLIVAASGCLGAFPRVVHYDGDGRKDLLVGLANGNVKIYLNTNTDADPVFDNGAYVQAGSAGSPISVSARATPSLVDWNNDGMKDIVAGGYYGTVQVYLNEGTDEAPEFGSPILVQSDGSTLDVGYRSSPAVADLDGDGMKDLLVGDTPGQLRFYSNIGTDVWPEFGDYSLVTSEGEVIDLLGSARSRPFVCDWTDDGIPDILVGAGDGYIHLYQGLPEPASLLLLGLGAIMLRRKR
jgi:hypothetical protein